MYFMDFREPALVDQLGESVSVHLTMDHMPMVTVRFMPLTGVFSLDCQSVVPAVCQNGEMPVHGRQWPHQKV
jgi:hypothetical protein